ncbi:hypothetical protein [Lacimicrobium sp. SS2-24]|uniref:hypothetical protein n=1 Tax=Lacimicrobium sp. SS2-24 TaxID=2005569 RepID=UPI000B4B455A|nr:hypothetical protein [Lacimicrobium sp. SS2-24]
MAGITALSQNTLNSGLVDLSLSHDDMMEWTDRFKSGRRWVYLLSNQLCFKQAGHKIHLPNPGKETLLLWLEKIILGGQAAVLFVDNLELDEVRRTRLQQVCRKMDVLLVNLRDKPADANTLVYGPW